MKPDQIILAFLTASLVSTFYWHVIHPTALKGIKFRIFAKRDALRRLAISGSEDCNSFAYCELEAFICKSLAVVPSVSLASFILFSIRNCDSSKDESFQRFRSEASEELVKLMNGTVRNVLGIMVLNSPLLFLTAAVFIVILWVFGKFNKMIMFQKAEDFVDDLPFANYGNTGAHSHSQMA